MPNRALKKTFPVAIIAHRGYKKRYPENTLLAFLKAIEAKADYIELDVHKTADGHVVVTHDYTTGRLTDQNLTVRDTNLATLKELDFGQGEKIPTLQEVFELCKGKIGVNVEIKQEGLAESVNELIEANQVEDEVIISSFIHSEIDAIKKLNSKLCCATLEPSGGNILSIFLVTFMKDKFLKNAQKVNADAINPIHFHTTRKFCDKAHQLHLLVNPWTADTPKRWEKLIKAGADSIITNDPEGLYQFLTSYYSSSH
ncbi:MAG: glycerophosphodiester phosphodiesterase [Promethearchaeota archaeon]